MKTDIACEKSEGCYEGENRRPKDEIGAFCRGNHIRSMSLFGSVLRGDFIGRKRCE